MKIWRYKYLKSPLYQIKNDSGDVICIWRIIYFVDSFWQIYDNSLFYFNTNFGSEYYFIIFFYNFKILPVALQEQFHKELTLWQEPFPLGVNIRYRRSRTNTENHQGSPSGSSSGEESSNATASSPGSTKERLDWCEANLRRDQYAVLEIRFQFSLCINCNFLLTSWRMGGDFEILGGLYDVQICANMYSSCEEEKLMTVAITSLFFFFWLFPLDLTLRAAWGCLCNCLPGYFYRPLILEVPMEQKFSFWSWGALRELSPNVICIKNHAVSYINISFYKQKSRRVCSLTCLKVELMRAQVLYGCFTPWLFF